ncbi:dipeptide/oligopeptide/nickel ABC transporter permease/ATP-binding protein [Tomitella gaofuii]|uniref:dipeptide/oligopeptide/nickel ABC transporter permease/ATP-binding protein n=1 Tax=Tomitella gaofuii TaxID=2760083 RepID=UPI001C710489|nr:dipeptide/oligopeptide/nickel ABC transporter permease/ATP-binding protein [Tomitella gaofuii]
MSSTAEEDVQAARTAAGDARDASLWKRLVRNPMGAIALMILGIVVVAAVFGQWLAPLDPDQVDLQDALQPMSGSHWLGTDSAGRDVLSRLIVGSRTTLIAAALATVVAIVIGVPSGLVAGYFGGALDSAANWINNVLLSLPAIIVLLAVSASLGKSVWVSMAALGILMSPGMFRLTYTAVQSVRGELYVDAARVSGLSDVTIVRRHILVVVRAPLVIQAAILCGIAIGVQAILDFLGLGDGLSATWGLMLSEGFTNIYRDPMLAVWPAVAITVTVAAFVLLGNAVRDALEDKPQAPSTRRKGHKVRGGGEVAGAVPAPPAADHLLSVASLGIGYPRPDRTTKQVVQDVSLHVDRGEVLGLVGESGSGKTQTAYALLGLLPDEAMITGGRVVFDERTLVAPGSDHRRGKTWEEIRGKRIAYIPQEPMSNLDPNFTIGHQLVRPMVKVLKVSRREAKAKVLELLTEVGIPDPARTFAAYPHEVSGGMAQRVLIAGAVSCNPDLLIADEPTTALDVTVQADVLDLLRHLQQRRNMAVVLVTHDFGVVADLCDRVAVMQNGRIVETGTVRDVLRSPSAEYTGELLGAVLEGKEPMTTLSTTIGEEPVARPTASSVAEADLC